MPHIPFVIDAPGGLAVRVSRRWRRARAVAAVAVALERDDLGVVTEPVGRGCGDDVVAEDLARG